MSNRLGSATDDRPLSFVSCRCGVDMEFQWAPSAHEVRCFGCGARFSRPRHLPPAEPEPYWNPALAASPTASPTADRLPQFVRRAGLIAFVVAALAFLAAVVVFAVSRS